MENAKTYIYRLTINYGHSIRNCDMLFKSIGVQVEFIILLKQSS